jgi:hypothetical protein
LAVVRLLEGKYVRLVRVEDGVAGGAGGTDVMEFGIGCGACGEGDAECGQKRSGLLQVRSATLRLGLVGAVVPLGFDVDAHGGTIGGLLRAGRSKGWWVAGNAAGAAVCL